MNDYKVTDLELTLVANAIRTKGGTSASLSWPDGFISAISDISSGGIVPSGSLSISANGTYDVSSFANAVVSVPSGGDTSDLIAMLEGTTSSIHDTSLSVVKPYLFYRDSNILNTEFENALEIDESAFYGCSRLTAVSFKSCLEIKSTAFTDCINLSETYFPSCLSVFPYAFSNCIALSSISFPSCKNIGSSAFLKCTSLINAYFPECERVLANAFQSCSRLEAIALPKCKSIGAQAFSQCGSLKSINLPSCTSVGSSAFAFCSEMSTVSLPVCDNISGAAFQKCYKLLSLYVLSNSVVFLATSGVLLSTPIAGYTEKAGGVYGSIFVPASLVDAYKSAANWSYFSDRIAAYTE